MILRKRPRMWHHAIIAIIGICMYLSAFFGLSSSAKAAPAAGLSPVILSNGWSIHDIQTNDLGSVAFIGGGNYPYGTDAGVADGAVLVTGDGIDKFAAVGDPVQGRPGRVFAGFTSKSLNNHDEVAFVALTLAAGDSTNCLQLPWPSNCVEGLYLYSGGHIREIARPGDVAPDAGSRTFTGFGLPQLNDLDMIVFQAGVNANDTGPSTSGLFLFDGDKTHKIVIEGENPFQSGPIGRLYNRVYLSRRGVVTFCLGGIVAQYAGGRLTRILASGDPAPRGGAVPEFRGLVSLSGNREGDVVFETSGDPYENSGIYLVRSDGRTIQVLAQGDLAPGGGRFSLTYTYYRYHIPQTGLYDLNPQVNDAGEVLFISPVIGGAAAAGIFLYSGGQIRTLVVEGDPIASSPGLTPMFLWNDGYSVVVLLNNISFGPFGDVLFTAWQARYAGDISKVAIFRRLEGGTISSVTAQGDAAPGAGGKFADVSYPFVAANALGDVVFKSNLLNSSYVTGIFRATLPTPDIPNAGFEATTSDGLPERWTTSWTNFGNGVAAVYDSGGMDSFEGKSNLRLDLAPSGGALFVVSDPIAVSPGTDYLLQCRMRYNLSAESDSVYFTVIQSDSGGNTVGLNEIKGIQGDNLWTWQPRRLLFHTSANAAVIRIRFGLIASSASYLDIDAVGAREAP